MSDRLAGSQFYSLGWARVWRLIAVARGLFVPRLCCLRIVVF
jgi:hypothetical protein